MKSFKDDMGRSWDLVVDVGAIKACRDLCKVDLYTLFDGNETERILSDPPLVVDILHTLCRKQCDERKMTATDFGQMFVGDVLEQAGYALTGAVIDFFPSRRRAVLTATVEKGKELQDVIHQKLMATIEAMTLTDLLTATKPPAVQESPTPPDTLSGS